jgi:protein-S-isoprenylcysteine O-methyltransferase Ste14
VSIFILLLAIGLWGAIHSLLASAEAKGAAERWLGARAMRFYRLAYNVFSVLSFLPIGWLLLVLPDQALYKVPAPWSYLMLLGQAAAALLLVIGVLQTDTLSFVGLRQVFDPGHPSALVTNGLYRFVRHPLYTAGLLLMWLTPQVSVNLFTTYAALTVYLIIGARFEERKLLREFGEAYAAYRRHTPMLIPALSPKK